MSEFSRKRRAVRRDHEYILMHLGLGGYYAYGGWHNYRLVDDPEEATVIVGEVLRETPYYWEDEWLPIDVTELDQILEEIESKL